MRILVCSGLGVAGLSAVLATVSSSPTNANPPSRVLVVPAHRAYPAARPPRRRDEYFTPEPCITDYPSPSAYFVGVVGFAGNVAGGEDSAVLGGLEGEACGTDSGIGAGAGGLALGTGSFVAAGGYQGSQFVSPGENNVAAGVDSFVGAGDRNSISSSGNGSFIGGGNYLYAYETMPVTTGNTISGADSFIGAGDQNVVDTNEAFVGGGEDNAIVLAASYAAIVGGYNNNVSATTSFIGAGQGNVVAANTAFVGGGSGNKIEPTGVNGVVAGGYANVLNGADAAIGGGQANETRGAYAVVPGGWHDEAIGELSFAAGAQAQAQNPGSFVWSDHASGETPLTDGGANRFVVRASGGTFIYSSANSPYDGVELAAGSGTWASVSDRGAKTNIAPLDDATILSKVASLPISTWRYKTEAGVRHLGPMAQDFYAAFDVGEDDRHITAIDEDGVALAAIKALNEKLERKESENVAARADARKKDAEIRVLDERVRHLETAVATLLHHR